MNLTGIYCTLLMGKTLPVPLAPDLIETVREIQVVHNDSGPSGFNIEFHAGRRGFNGALDYAILNSTQVKPDHRVKILVTLQGQPQVLMDGVITKIRMENIDRAGASKVIVTGRDLSVMMNKEQVQTAHPAQPEAVIAAKIIAKYAKYQLVPAVIPPPILDIPNPLDWIPQQNGTDYNYLVELAERFGYVFYVTTGPSLLLNTAYWGPPRRLGIPQPALSMELGYGRNVQDISFEYDALAASAVVGELQDRELNTTLPISASSSTRLPLSLSALANENTQELLPKSEGGLTYMEAQSRAQGVANRSRDRVVVAEGSLNTARYNRILQARGLVGVRGAGLKNDGLYYVKQVVHTLGLGSYQQKFTLTRDGVGATVPAVRV
jgi:hypothetical protein